jgi:predicted nucleic acid-binding protein
MTGYLLDTNIVSEIRKGNRADQNLLTWFRTIPEAELFLSVLALGEVRNGLERVRPKDPAQARALEHWLMDLEAKFSERVLPVTAAIADRWGRLSAVDPLSVIDCLMAATALENDLTLVTRNVQDVKRTGVRLLNPFDAPKS